MSLYRLVAFSQIILLRGTKCERN